MAGDRELRVQLLLEDKQALGKLKKALGEIDAQGKQTASSFGGSWKAMAIQIGAVVVAAEGLRRFMGASITAAMEQEDAINRLNVALKNQGTYTTALSASYQKMADDLQRSTRYSDESINAVQQQLVALGNVGPAQMDRVVRAVLDFSTATGKDLQTSALLFAKAAQGNTAALSRYGIVIDETIPKAEKFNALLDLTRQRMGGAAQADLATFSGALSQLSKQWGELMEELGKIITQNPEVIGAIRKTTGALIEWIDIIKNNKEEIGSFLTGSVQGAELAALEIEKFVLAVVIGIERIKASGWQGIWSFLTGGVTGDAGSADGGGAQADAGADQYIQQLEAQLQEMMQRTDQLRQQMAANGPGGQSIGTSMFSPDPAQVQIAVDQTLPILQAGMVALGTMTNSFTDGFKTGFGEVDLSMKGLFTEFGKGVGTSTKQATSMFASTTTQILMGQKSASEGFKELGMGIVAMFAKMAIEIAAQKALAIAFNFVVGAASAAAAAVVGAAWATPAALASLATGGTNATTAKAAIIGTVALSKSLAALSSAVPGAAEGATVTGGGTVMVGERGPELLNLPRGASVIPLSQNSSPVFNINISIAQASIRHTDDIRSLAMEISAEIDAITRGL